MYYIIEIHKLHKNDLTIQSKCGFLTVNLHLSQRPFLPESQLIIAESLDVFIIRTHFSHRCFFVSPFI